MALAAPGIAAENAVSAEPAAFKKAVPLHRLKKILRACRSEPATTAGSAKGVKNWRNKALVTTDEDADEPFHGVGGAGFKKRP